MYGTLHLRLVVAIWRKELGIFIARLLNLAGAPTMAAAADFVGDQSPSSARLAMMELANMISVPMSLNAIVRLGVPDAIWQSGANTPLTAAEILPHLRPPPPTSAATNLQRLLRLLSSHGVFTEHSSSNHLSYSLTSIGQTLISGEGSYAPYVLQHHQDAIVKSWPLLHEAVVDPEGQEPFRKANGKAAYLFYGDDPDANELMLKAMWGLSVPFIKTMLDGYEGGFDGVRRLVDVGGSSGACLYMIMKRVPTVEAGVNFDLPEVVAGAPEFPGVIHVGGDMFKSIPRGDAIFMKWVLMTWTDDECRTILKNCYDALPEGGGKVIACEPVAPEVADGSCRTRALLASDIFGMTVYSAQSRGRTEEDYRLLGFSAGFRGFRAIYVDPYYTVLEFS